MIVRHLAPLRTLALLGCTSAHLSAQVPAPDTAPDAAPDLTSRDVALLREAFHLQAGLGTAAWPGWEPAEVPVLYLSGEQAFMMHHPAPPDGFTRVHSAALGRELLVRPRTAAEDDLQATYPIAGRSTVVIAAPQDDADAHRWTLVFAHEMFHCFQGDGQRHIDPFTGEYAEHHELSFPFPYDDESVRAALRLEAELVHRLATGAAAATDTGPAPPQRAPGEEAADDEPPASGIDRVPARLLEQCAVIDRAVMADERHLLFKRWEEWKEGVAKYVERELSRAAAEPGRHEPLPEFAALFPGDGYAAAWDEHFAGQLAPVRFVGDGVRGRVMFYYLGMGKAVALDRLLPEWKARYRESSLDELLVEAAGI
jgi:hypothetical protein